MFTRINNLKKQYSRRNRKNFTGNVKKTKKRDGEFREKTQTMHRDVNGQHLGG